MAKRLAGKPAADALTVLTAARASTLVEEGGIIPTLAIVRVGENPGDMAYERGALKRCESIGIDVRRYVFPDTVTEDEVLDTIGQINEDDGIHGCLILRPLPAQIRDSVVCKALDPRKDVDGITPGAMATIFMGRGDGYPPCTAAACMALLAHYNIDVAGKNVVVIGRSLVIGRPVSMLLMHKNATVTICHTKTQNRPAITKAADIIVVAAGRADTLTAEDLGENQIILDVGINFTPEGKMIGDVRAEAAEPLCAALTPVPGGIGAMTTAVLASHVVKAAELAAVL